MGKLALLRCELIFLKRQTMLNVGSLVRARRTPTDWEGLPIGLILSLDSDDDGCWCKILWDDGQIVSCWESEIMEVQ